MARLPDGECHLLARVARSQEVSQIIMAPDRDRQLRASDVQRRSYQLRRPQAGDAGNKRNNPAPIYGDSKDNSRGRASETACKKRLRTDPGRPAHTGPHLPTGKLSSAPKNLGVIPLAVFRSGVCPIPCFPSMGRWLLHY